MSQFDYDDFIDDEYIEDDLVQKIGSKFVRLSKTKNFEKFANQKKNSTGLNKKEKIKNARREKEHMKDFLLTSDL